MNFSPILQPDAMDCGPTCLQMIARHYGRSYTLQTLRDRCNITREGVSMLGISEAAESIGFRSMGVKVGYDKLSKDAPLPLIAHWNQEHFVVVYAIKNDKVFVADPAIGSHIVFKVMFFYHYCPTKNIFFVQVLKPHGLLLFFYSKKK